MIKRLLLQSLKYIIVCKFVNLLFFAKLIFLKLSRITTLKIWLSIRLLSTLGRFESNFPKTWFAQNTEAVDVAKRMTEALKAAWKFQVASITSWNKHQW